MSRILDRLKEAEAQRERIVAKRRRLEAEAEAALAAGCRTHRTKCAGWRLAQS